MWPGTANSGGWRSPQASAGTPNNTGELAQIDKKKPQLITVGASVLVGRRLQNLLTKTNAGNGFISFDFQSTVKNTVTYSRLHFS